MFIARAVLSETSSVRSGIATEPPVPTSFRSLAMPLLTELGRRLGVRFYKHATPTELSISGIVLQRVNPKKSSSTTDEHRWTRICSLLPSKPVSPARETPKR